MGNSSDHLRVGNLTDIGLNPMRTKNEDYYGKFEGEFGTLLLLCDGMGGHEGGEVASRLTVESIRQYFEGNYLPGDEVLTIRKSVDFAQNKLLEAVQQNPELQGMGTTLVLLLIRSGNFWYAHTGDSRLYLKRGDSLNQLTKDHSEVQMMVDSGELTPDQAREHPNRNIITKAIGHKDYLPEVSGPHVLQQNDVFLLCSDGLTEYLKDEELLHHLEEEPQVACQNMVELAKSRGGMDNITLQIAQVLHRGEVVIPEIPPPPKAGKLPSFTIIATLLIFVGAVVWYALSLRSDPDKPKPAKTKKEAVVKEKTAPATPEQPTQPKPEASALAAIEALADAKLVLEGQNERYQNLFNKIRQPNQATKLKFIRSRSDKLQVFILPGHAIYIARGSLEDRNSHNLHLENMQALIIVATLLSEAKRTPAITEANWESLLLTAGSATIPDAVYEKAKAFEKTVMELNPRPDGTPNQGFEGMVSRFKSKYNNLIRMSDFNLAFERAGSD